MTNLVEELSETEPSPCRHGEIITDGHACYCHHPDAYRKCPQWRNDEPWEECEYYEERT